MRKYDMLYFSDIARYREWVINTNDEIVSVISMGEGIVVTLRKNNNLCESGDNR